METGIAIKPAERSTEMISDYSSLMTHVPYTLHNGFFCSNEQIPKGAIPLYLSVKLYQVADLISILEPVINKFRLPFVIAADLNTARLVTYGHLGFEMMGRIATLYLADAVMAAYIARLLGEKTKGLSGPFLPGTVSLGPTVYLPAEHAAQFPAAMVQPVQSIKLGDNRFRITGTVKEDLRGDVFKAVYLKGLLRSATCIIKRGNNSMWSDEHGRDISDRLKWQQQIHSQISAPVRVPKVLDYFTEGGNSYLALEFIKGKNLGQLVIDTMHMRSWLQLSREEKLSVLSIVIACANAVKALHAQGILHRDLSPGNFIINESDGIYLLDLELAVDMRTGYPSPAFPGGTTGYMSPQQALDKAPAFSDDYYAFGGVLLTVFTGISPLKFSLRDLQGFIRDMYFFIGDYRISRLIATCLQPSADHRPDMERMIKLLSSYKDEMETSLDLNDGFMFQIQERNKIEKILESAVNGLTHPAFAAEDRVFATIRTDITRTNNLQVSQLSGGGFDCPIAGLLMLYSGNHNNLSGGIEVLELLNRHSGYFREQYLNRVYDLPAGLKDGAAGMALSVAQGIRSGVLQRDDELYNFILSCFDRETENLSLAFGKAGQGIAMMQAKDIIDPDYSSRYLKIAANNILFEQKENGDWITVKGRKTTPCLAYGTAGIVYYLLEYYAYTKNDYLIAPIEKALKRLTEILSERKRKHTWFETDDEQALSTLIGDPGIAYVFIRAYELIGKSIYKNTAEKVLSTLEPFPVLSDYSLANGMAGLGMVYVSAAKAFRQQVWGIRAGWIASVLCTTLHTTAEGMAYWNMDGKANADGSLLTGTLGPIFFLQSYLDYLDNK